MKDTNHKNTGCDECPKKKDILSENTFSNKEDYEKMKKLVPNLFDTSSLICPENKLQKCSQCDVKLCPEHAKRALKYGNYYKQKDIFMCDNCCWNELT